MTPASISDWRKLARRRLPRILFDYIDGGAYGEATLRRNMEAFGDVKLRQRVMLDVSNVNLSTELFGRTLSMPVALGPVGMSGMYARRGEAQAARAAEAAGVPFTLSTLGLCSVEEVSAACETPIWYQLYMIKDRGWMAELMARVSACGCPVLVFTVDLQVPGTRWRDVRSGFAGQPTPRQTMGTWLSGAQRPRWVWDVHLHGRPHAFGNIPSAKGIAAYWRWVSANFDPSITWKDLDWVRERWKGKIVIKGVLDAEDARAAAEHGADGIVVSNHGGRQLDSVPASIEALPSCVEAVDGRLKVLLDGGVRSGLDVLKALALGADGVLLGRAWAYALAGGGQAGVARMLETMRKELAVAAALTGCTDVRQAGRELLAR